MTYFSPYDIQFNKAQPFQTKTHSFPKMLNPSSKDLKNKKTDFEKQRFMEDEAPWFRIKIELIWILWETRKD